MEWLERRWHLPREARAEVEKLMASHEMGGTALELENGETDWGSAAGWGGPLVVSRYGGRCFLQSSRTHALEAAVARRFEELAQADEELSFSGDLFFAGFGAGVFGDEQQQKAAQVAAARRMALITGGPGTGKTFTLARLLAVLVASGYQDVVLAAPTGKAADRMRVAVGAALRELPGVFAHHLDELYRIAEASSTVHKVLQYHPVRGFRVNGENPLANRVLILDECSMVDLEMWQSVLDALRTDGRLFLFGDPNQLESVGAGMVFRDLVEAATGEHAVLAQCHVHLSRSRRFEDRPGIVSLARGIEKSDAAAVRALLQAPGADAAGVRWLEWPEKGRFHFEMLPEVVREQLEKIAFASSPLEALAQVKRMCILSAHRRFAFGAHAISERVDEHFIASGRARNRPVVIEVNDAATGLRNGNVGVVHVDDAGNTVAYFEDVNGGMRSFPLSMLPESRGAWALTIHRSQGSEYDTVMVVLPGAESPLATRELIYTAVTRARHEVYLAGSMDSVEKAVATASGRCTLLAKVLWDNPCLD